VQVASLPKTASSLPLLALMGFLCLSVGISLRALCAR
jgi:LPXTG-motif cell wall-anchored protein